MSRGWWEFQSTAFAVNGTVIHNQNQPSPAIAGESHFHFLLPVFLTFDHDLRVRLLMVVWHVFDGWKLMRIRHRNDPPPRRPNSCAVLLQTDPRLGLQ